MASEATASSTGGVISVLLVDDHEDFRHALGTMLREQPDIDVVGEAADGSAALDLVSLAHPHVVLMDVTMPGMDGFDATRALRLSSPGSRVVILSSRGGAQAVRDGLAAGARAYLVKGCPPETLLQAVRAAGQDEPTNGSNGVAAAD